ncbi:MAG: hypothetical protein JJE39_16850, partial [Vicinamibacteria bacterium]|nr:hypothetical protein [Vicinamibacteria bacterium]
PWLFWTFWGMTSLLAGTFVLGGAHTLLWLPRAFEMRRELKAEEEAEERESAAAEDALVERRKAAVVPTPAVEEPVEAPAGDVVKNEEASNDDETEKDEGSL